MKKVGKEFSKLSSESKRQKLFSIYIKKPVSLASPKLSKCSSSNKINKLLIDHEKWIKTQTELSAEIISEYSHITNVTHECHKFIEMA